jgi:hypothetical protein
MESRFKAGFFFTSNSTRLHVKYPEPLTDYRIPGFDFENKGESAAV